MRGIQQPFLPPFFVPGMPGFGFIAGFLAMLDAPG
jgi:hypothetical protein